MQLRRSAPSPHQAALRAVTGEPGLSGIFFVLLAAGAGMLLDFWVLHLHPVFSVGLPLASIPACEYWTLRKVLRMAHRPKPGYPDYLRNLALASVAGQSGCLTVIIIFAALFAGMFLDARLDTHPIFTIGLMILSVPVSLYAMIRLMLSSIHAIKLSQESSGPAAHEKENAS